MADRPLVDIDDELLAEWNEQAEAVGADVTQSGRPGDDELVIADLLLLSERVIRMVAEVDRLRAENTALRSLVARFYTQAWEDPLTDDEMALLDPIVNAAVEEADRG